MSEVEKLISAKEVAEIFGLSVETVRKKHRKFGLPHYKVGWLVKFRASEIEEWLQKRHKEKHMQMPKLVRKII